MSPSRKRTIEGPCRILREPIMTETSIEWTDATWNPVAGCSVLSPGCTNCYAMRMAERLEAMGTAKYVGPDSPIWWPPKVGPVKFAWMKPGWRLHSVGKAAHGFRQLHVRPVPRWSADGVHRARLGRDAVRFAAYLSGFNQGGPSAWPNCHSFCQLCPTCGWEPASKALTICGESIFFARLALRFDLFLLSRFSPL